MTASKYKEQNDYSNCKWEMVEVANQLEPITYTNKILKSDFLPKGKYPIIDQSENFIAGYWNNEQDLFKVDKPVVIFGDHTRIFKFVNFDFVIGADGTKILLPNNKWNSKFFFYLLKSLEINNLGYSRHFKELKVKKIPLPPLEVQEEIVKELDSYQAVIDGAQKVVDNWKPTLPINPNWEKVKLEEVCLQITDGTHSTPTYTETGVPFLRVTDITGTNDSKKFISLEEHNTLIKRCHPQKNDVLYTKNGTIGIAKLVNWDWDFSIFVSLCLLKPNTTKIMPKYLELFLNSQIALNQAHSHSKTGAITNLHLVEIKSFIIPLPNLQEQQEVITKIKEEEKAVEECKKLIEIHQAKINTKIQSIWGDDCE